MEHLDGFAGLFGRGHFHEGEAPGFAREFIHHHIDGTDNTGRGEVLLKVAVCGLIGEVSYEET